MYILIFHFQFHFAQFAALKWLWKRKQKWFFVEQTQNIYAKTGKTQFTIKWGNKFCSRVHKQKHILFYRKVFLAFTHTHSSHTNASSLDNKNGHWCHLIATTNIINTRTASYTLTHAHAYACLLHKFVCLYISDVGSKKLYGRLQNMFRELWMKWIASGNQGRDFHAKAKKSCAQQQKYNIHNDNNTS